MIHRKSSNCFSYGKQFLLLAAALMLAAMISGCYTILQHQSTSITEVEENNECQRCHLSNNPDQSYEQIWTGHVVESSNYWLNYYENAWWSPTRWEKTERATSRTRPEDSGTSVYDRQRGQQIAESSFRNELTPRWKQVLRESSHSDSVRFGVRDVGINPLITAPRSSVSYGGATTSGLPSFNNGGRNEGSTGTSDSENETDPVVTEEKPANKVRTKLTPRFPKKPQEPESTPQPEKEEKPAKPVKEEPKVQQKPKG